jgi:hypothetical protein
MKIQIFGLFLLAAAVLAQGPRAEPVEMAALLAAAPANANAAAPSNPSAVGPTATTPGVSPVAAGGVAATPPAPVSTAIPITEVSLDASTIELGTRQQWCTIHLATCQNICLDKMSKAFANACDPRALTSTCTCANNFTPDTRQYTNTIPYFKCINVLNNCEKTCNSQEGCINNCRSSYHCVASDPPKSNSTARLGTPADPIQPFAVGNVLRMNDASPMAPSYSMASAGTITLLAAVAYVM